MCSDEDMPLKCGPSNKCKRKSEMMVGPQQETEANRDSPTDDPGEPIKVNRVNTRAETLCKPINNFGVYGMQELAQI